MLDLTCINPSARRAFSGISTRTHDSGHELVTRAISQPKTFGEKFAKCRNTSLKIILINDEDWNTLKKLEVVHTLEKSANLWPSGYGYEVIAGVLRVRARKSLKNRRVEELIQVKSVKFKALLLAWCGILGMVVPAQVLTMM
ncbi:hypothetical protein TNCV_4660241 [Trichonephila clavipes]|uniref:Uncharacterized protein n=1 Tax=Trichonephila clavipes TaxID=2585209 RepID=A0A8X6S981_TRICX|nr:hypothetical protein TNCV_4660241 [Trichonephila clavipes]